MALEGLINRDHQVASNRTIRSPLLDLQRLTRQAGINVDLHLSIIGRGLNRGSAVGLVQ